MNIQKYIKECYGIAQSKGFYPEDSKIEDHLMGIVSEIGEAYEAHRLNKISSKMGFALTISEIVDNFDNKTYSKYFEEFYKDTFEDELADVFIRLFNLMGHYNIDPKNDWFIYGIKEVDLYIDDNFLLNHSFFQIHIINRVSKLSNKDSKPYPSDLGMIYQLLIEYCKFHKIPIEKHIQAKIEYNKTREHLHGKEY